MLPTQRWKASRQCGSVVSCFPLVLALCVPVSFWPLRKKPLQHSNNAQASYPNTTILRTTTQACLLHHGLPATCSITFRVRYQSSAGACMGHAMVTWRVSMVGMGKPLVQQRPQGRRAHSWRRMARQAYGSIRFSNAELACLYGMHGEAPCATGRVKSLCYKACTLMIWLQQSSHSTGGGGRTRGAG